MLQKDVELYEIRPGISTRTVTLRDGSRVSFALAAVESAITQVRQRPLPIAREHLNYLPPLGWITDGEVIVAADGESEAVLRGYGTASRKFGDLALAPVDVSRLHGFEQTDVSIDLSVEPRNFEADVWAELSSTAPLAVRKHTAWSDLPPLVWIIGPIIAWGGIKFAGSVLEQLGSSLGKQIATWIAHGISKSKEPSRDSLVELRFESPQGQDVLGYCPVSATGPQVVADLQAAFEQTLALADFAAGLMDDGRFAGLRRAAFLWDGSRWRLGWWATAEEVLVTDWFSHHHPDPERLLGHPLAPDVDGLSPDSASFRRRRPNPRDDRDDEHE